MGQTLATQRFDKVIFTKPGPATDVDSIMSEEGKFFAMAWENVMRTICYNSVKQIERE